MHAFSILLLVWKKLFESDDNSFLGWWTFLGKDPPAAVS
jgi:hypothetical protein